MFRKRHLSVFLVFIGLFFFSDFVVADQQKKVIITYQDASELKVTNFQFFTSHIPVQGFYMKSISDRATELLLKTDRLWKMISPKEIKLIKMELDSKKRFFNTELELKNGEKLRGTSPIKFEETWKSGTYFYVIGTIKIFGKEGKWKKSLYDIQKIESRKENNTFIVKLKNGEEKVVKTIAFGIHAEMPYASPNITGMANPLRIKSEGVEVDIPLKEIDNLEFHKDKKIRMIMKNGETGYISFRDKITRIYGTISKTEVLFDEIYSPEGFNIKSIKF
jgi:hypothetical protein